MSDNSRVRVSIVGVVIVALFASLFARLWFLQMGPEQSLGQRRELARRTRVIQTESPRGEILDRNGKVLAQDVAAWAVTVDRDLEPDDARPGPGPARGGAADPGEDAAARTTTACASRRSSPRSSRCDPARAAARDPRAPRGLSGRAVIELTIRSYPYDGLASQLLGYVGEIGARPAEAAEGRRDTRPAT